jgi:hypothetical protein
VEKAGARLHPHFIAQAQLDLGQASQNGKAVPVLLGRKDFGPLNLGGNQGLATQGGQFNSSDPARR